MSRLINTQIVVMAVKADLDHLTATDGQPVWKSTRCWDVSLQTPIRKHLIIQDWADDRVIMVVLGGVSAFLYWICSLMFLLRYRWYIIICLVSHHWFLCHLWLLQLISTYLDNFHPSERRRWWGWEEHHICSLLMFKAFANTANGEQTHSIRD